MSLKKDIDIVDEYGERFYKSLAKDQTPNKIGKETGGGLVFYFSQLKIDAHKKKLKKRGFDF